MKNTLKAKVVGVSVLFDEDESGALNYWFAHRLEKDPARIPEFNLEKWRRGEHLMIELLKMLREGFHKDGE